MENLPDLLRECWMRLKKTTPGKYHFNIIDSSLLSSNGGRVATAAITSCIFRN